MWGYDADLSLPGVTVVVLSSWVVAIQGLFFSAPVWAFIRRTLEMHSKRCILFFIIRKSVPAMLISPSASPIVVSDMLQYPIHSLLIHVGITWNILQNNTGMTFEWHLVFTLKCRSCWVMLTLEGNQCKSHCTDVVYNIYLFTQFTLATSKVEKFYFGSSDDFSTVLHPLNCCTHTTQQ